LALTHLSHKVQGPKAALHAVVLEGEAVLLYNRFVVEVFAAEPAPQSNTAQQQRQQ